MQLGQLIKQLFAAQVVRHFDLGNEAARVLEIPRVPPILIVRVTFTNLFLVLQEAQSGNA